MAAFEVRFSPAENSLETVESLDTITLYTLLAYLVALPLVTICFFSDAEALVITSVKSSSDTPFLYNSLISDKIYELVIPFSNALKNNFSTSALSYLTPDFNRANKTI